MLCIPPHLFRRDPSSSLVHAVRCQSSLGLPVHPGRADLNLHQLTARLSIHPLTPLSLLSRQCGQGHLHGAVQAAVAILLGCSNVIFHPAWHLPPDPRRHLPHTVARLLAQPLRLFLHFGGYRAIANLEPYTGLRALFLESNAIDAITGFVSSDAGTVELRESSGGKYLGVTITVTATSREQLDELYRTLSTHPMVKVVL